MYVSDARWLRTLRLLQLIALTSGRNQLSVCAHMHVCGYVRVCVFVCILLVHASVRACMHALARVPIFLLFFLAIMAFSPL